MPLIRSLGAATLLAVLALPSGAQGRPTDGYHTNARLTAVLDSIARSKPALVNVSVLATSPGRRPVHVVRLGADDKPAVLILAGAYGPQVSSSEVALRIVRDLARDQAGAQLLAQRTVYVVPRLNPDATEAFFGALRWERAGNDTKFDDDRDMADDEDGPDDLNGDGLITMMRVKATDGEWIADATDPALMRRADATKGERGMYRLMMEGRDNDNDGQYNEDAVGGTDISKNFANNFRFFSDNAGLHPFSAEESRAVAEFVSTHDNIAAVYVLGMQDNLIKAWEGRTVPGIGGNPQGTSAGGPLTASLPADNAWFNAVSADFKRITRWSEGPASAADVGDPLSWAYFHMGRFAFGSRVWWPGKAAADSTRRAPTPDPLAAERNDYRWLKSNNPSAFVEWQAVQGFMIDGQQVEVGGFAPGATLNPVGTELDSLASRHGGFVRKLVESLPSVQVKDISVTEVGPRVYRIRATVVNEGFLPSNAAIGVRSRLPQRVRVEMALGRDQQLTSGRRMQYVNALRGSGGNESFEWLVVGAPNSTVTLNVGSPNAGLSTQTITLRAR
ncbi:MAG: hypothetical protein C0503_08900 [Gemmatimonas sp.]|nr:hypothetical protein [Gemmatimonas sp.]